MYYTCECRYQFKMPEPPDALRDYLCPKCGSTSESHRISNGGLGRVWHMIEAWLVEKPPNWVADSPSSGPIEVDDE